MIYDAIVVGLGPAGSVAAYTLAKGGFRVIAFDKERFPRYKSCGGCVSVKVRGLLDFDFSPVVEDEPRGAVFTYKSGLPAEIVSDTPVACNVMREKFDAFLAAKAKEAGAEVMDGRRITGIAEDGDSVSAATADGDFYKARFLIGADGASGFLGREFFKLNPRDAAVSITAEVPYRGCSLRDFSGRVYIDFGSVPFGYGWIFPKKECLSVGVAGDAVKTGGKTVKEAFTSLVKTHPVLKGLEISGVEGWSVPIFNSSQPLAARGRVALAGDTAHLVDPFLGEGIYYAIKTGRQAARTVADSLKKGAAGLGAYLDWLEKELYPELSACEKISSLVYNHPRLWYNIIEKEPHIMLRFYDVVRGAETAESFYNWVRQKIRSKPLKVLRRWIESRFLPA